MRLQLKSLCRSKVFPRLSLSLTCSTNERPMISEEEEEEGAAAPHEGRGMGSDRCTPGEFSRCTPHVDKSRRSYSSLGELIRV